MQSRLASVQLVAFVPFENVSSRLEMILSDLNRGHASGQQVLAPIWILVCTLMRRENNEAIAVWQEPHRVREAPTALASFRRQQQECGASEILLVHLTTVSSKLLSQQAIALVLIDHRYLPFNVSRHDPAERQLPVASYELSAARHVPGSERDLRARRSHGRTIRGCSNV
jgi:hypothetical protein